MKVTHGFCLGRRINKGHIFRLFCRVIKHVKKKQAIKRNQIKTELHIADRKSTLTYTKTNLPTEKLKKNEILISSRPYLATTD